MTICAYHVSLAISHACMCWQNGLMLHISVYHSEEVTSIFFSMHFTQSCGQKNVSNKKNCGDKKKQIFSIFFISFLISPKIFVQTPNASYVRPRTFKWATGSKGVTIGSFLQLQQSFEHLFWENFMASKKTFSIFRIMI